MQLIRIAAGVLNQTPLDWDGNQRNISAVISAARDEGVTVLCLPELCVTGYGCEDAFLSSGVHRMALRVLLELVPETRGMIVSFGLPVQYRGAMYNAACLAVDGKIAGFVGKQHLAGEGLHYEPRWFKRWPAHAQTEIQVAGAAIPFGDLLIDAGGVLFGFEICEDAWVANRPGAGLARRGVDVILNPSASHFAFDKQNIRQRFVLEGSRAFTATYVYSNLLGNEAGRALYDGGAMIASAGRMIVEGPRFQFSDYHVTAATVDVEANRMNRARTASYDPQYSDAVEQVVRVPFSYPDARTTRDVSNVAPWETGPKIKEEEFTRGVALGLFDYLRKSRMRGFVVSLSGGADSSAVATLCALAIRLSVAELGLARVLDKLGRAPHHANLPAVEQAVKHGNQATGDQASVEHADADQLVHQILACVYQATRNSSQTTRDAAHDVATALNAEFLEFDVDDMVQRYTQIVSTAIGRKLDWDTDDLALQNIQARTRAPGVWLLANLRGALLLATSNRSEAAVGYATMDGDTCGGLSPIAGIDKAFLRTWLRWMETDGPAETGPLDVLRVVNVLPPTAELRPAASMQTDESDLMPYEMLDAIERAAIRDKLMPLEVLQQFEVTHPDVTQKQLVEWIDRFFRLWSRNQWKRERYAPSFHLDDENLDPKTWCRFPILSGGFQRELAEMRAYVENADNV